MLSKKELVLAMGALQYLVSVEEYGLEDEDPTSLESHAKHAKAIVEKIQKILEEDDGG